MLYVSPLKALAVDVERNLRAPLAGIRHTADRLGVPVARRARSGSARATPRPTSGAGSPAARPDILITTPESLFLMLTSQAREALRGVETVILDEVHAVAGTKRGAHLAVTLERLDELLERPAQRIGLSATVRPVEEVARFLGGSAPVEVVAPDLGEGVGPLGRRARRGHDRARAPRPTRSPRARRPVGARHASIWPHVEERVVDLVEQHRSTIVFCQLPPAGRAADRPPQRDRRRARRRSRSTREAASVRAGAR